MIFKNIEKKPRLALNCWKKYVGEVKQNQVLDALKTQKLKNELYRVPVRTLRKALKIILTSNDAIKGAVRTIARRVAHKPKVYIAKWEKVVGNIKQGLIFDACRTAKLKNSLGKLPARTIRNSFQRMLGGGDRICGSLRNILRIYKNCTKVGMDRWKAFTASCASKHYFDLFRTEKLRTAMFRLILRTIKNTHDRISGMGNSVKGAMKNIFSAYEKMQRLGFSQWKRYVDNCRSKKYYDNFRSLSLTISLSNLVKPMLKTAVSLLVPDLSKVKRHISVIVSKINQRPRLALVAWKDYIVNCKNKALLDNRNSSKLSMLLGGIPKRVLKNALDRIIGDGNRVKGAIKQIAMSFKNKTKASLEVWKKFVYGCKHKVFFDNIRSRKAKDSLARISNRVLRYTIERILGEGNAVKGALRKIALNIRKIPKTAMDKWKKYISECKSHKLLSGMQSYKLKSAMQKIPLRVLKDSYQRIIGDGNKTKGALKTIFLAIDKRSRLSFFLWKEFSAKCSNKLLLSNLQSHKLHLALQEIPRRSLKTYFSRISSPDSQIVSKALRSLGIIFIKGPATALTTWKNYLFSARILQTKKEIESKYKAIRIKTSLDKPTRKVLRTAKSHSCHDNFKVKAVLKALSKAVVKRNSDALRLWNTNSIARNTEAITTKLIREGKGYQLRIPMIKLVKRSFLRTMMRINPETTKVGKAFRYFEGLVKNKTRYSWNSWNKYIEKVKKNELLSNIKTLKLRHSLESVSKATSRRALLLILGEGSRVKGAIRGIVFNFNKKLSGFFMKWTKFVSLCKNRQFFDEMRSQKLQKSLSKLTRFHLQSVTSRIIGGGNKVSGIIIECLQRLNKTPKLYLEHWKKYVQLIHKKQLLDSFKSEKLKNSLQNLTRRILRTSVQRMIGEGDNIKGAIKRIILSLNKKSKIALDAWKTYLHSCKTKNLFDNYRSEKLKNSLRNLTTRSIKNVLQRVTGEGSRAKGMLMLLSMKSQKVPRSALKCWKEYLFSIREGELMDRMRATKLKASMFALTIRTLRQVTVKIISGQGIIRNSLNLLMQKHRTGCKNTLQIWAKYIERCKRGELFDAIRREKLKSRLLSINRRFLRDCIERILGDGSKVKGNLRRIIMQFNKATMIKFQRWKEWMVSVKERESRRKIKGLQLKSYLVKFSEKLTKGCIDRIFGNGGRALGAIRRILTCMKLRYFKSFRDWKENIMLMKQRDLLNAQKLAVLTESIVKHSARLLLDAILGDSRIRRMLNKLVKNYQDIQKLALFNLWGRVEKIRTIKKMNAAYFLYKQLLTCAKKQTSLRFKFWKNLEYLRRRRIMKKVTGKMIRLMSISYESALWKWKIIISSTGSQLSPKYSLFLKRLLAVSHNYQKRLEQFALFKLVLSYKCHPLSMKLNLPQALAKILKSPREEFSHTRNHSCGSVEGKAMDYPSSISTMAQSSISKEESLSINQMGALEVVFLQFKEIILRKYTWVFASLCNNSRQVGGFENEKNRFVEQIMELRFEKHSLLEDNNILRIHNDNLVTSLENNNTEFQELCLVVDHLKLTSMIRLLSRLVEYSMYGAFSKLSLI